MTANDIENIRRYFSEISEMKCYLETAEGLKGLNLTDSSKREYYLTPANHSAGLHEKIRKIFQEEIEDIKKILLEKYLIRYEDESK